MDVKRNLVQALTLRCIRVGAARDKFPEDLAYHDDDDCVLDLSVFNAFEQLQNLILGVELESFRTCRYSTQFLISVPLTSEPSFVL